MIRPLSNNDEYYFYTCATLIDISRSVAVRSYNKDMAVTEKEYRNDRNQRRNWESMLQVISLRCQPFEITAPKILRDQDLSQFGSEYTTGDVWIFSFGVEAESIFDLPNDTNGALVSDLHNVPIITGLLESVIIDPEMIDTISDARKNTIILR